MLLGVHSVIALTLIVLVAASMFGCAAHESGSASAPAPAQDMSEPMPVAATCGSIAKVSLLKDVYLAGQPSAEDLAQAKKLGVKTVVNLRRPSELKGFDEARAVADLGMTYVNIPFEGAADLSDEVFERARQQLCSAPRPLLFHCASSNRVGAVWYAHRVLDAKIAPERALAEAKAVGMRTPELQAKAEDYIQRLTR